MFCIQSAPATWNHPDKIRISQANMWFINLRVYTNGHSTTPIARLGLGTPPDINIMLKSHSSAISSDKELFSGVQSFRTCVGNSGFGVPVAQRYPDELHCPVRALQAMKRFRAGSTLLYTLISIALLIVLIDFSS